MLIVLFSAQPAMTLRRLPHVVCSSFLCVCIACGGVVIGCHMTITFHNELCTLRILFREYSWRTAKLRPDETKEKKKSDSRKVFSCRSCICTVNVNSLECGHNRPIDLVNVEHYCRNFAKHFSRNRLANYNPLLLPLNSDLMHSHTRAHKHGRLHVKTQMTCVT